MAGVGGCRGARGCRGAQLVSSAGDFRAASIGAAAVAHVANVLGRKHSERRKKSAHGSDAAVSADEMECGAKDHGERGGAAKIDRLSAHVQWKFAGTDFAAAGDGPGVAARSRCADASAVWVWPA